MADEPTGDLQFDQVEIAGTSDTPQGVICSTCHQPIRTEYYDINSHVVCETCRHKVELVSETPKGPGPLLLAGIFGFGAAIGGAAIYYAVIALAHLEIGLVAILCGYMVGYAVRRGANGRGGLRFQVLAVVLTYVSIAMAYTPLAIQGMRERAGTEQTADSSGRNQPSAAARPVQPDPAAVPARPSIGRLLLALSIMAGLILALPILSVVGSLPTGLLSAFIIGIGMRQAWRMTGAPNLTILGPYRVSDTVAAAPA